MQRVLLFFANNDLSFKKGRLLFSLLMLFLANFASAQSSGIFESYAILSLNGGADAYYDMQATTGNPDFQGANLGSFTFGTNTLVVKGGENKTYKNGGCNINSSAFHYRVYPTATPSGSYININQPFSANLPNPGDQSWVGTSGNTNLIAGLVPGNYTIEVYSDAEYDSCGTGTHFSSNGGSNYKATFTVAANPALPVIVTGALTGNGGYATLGAAITAIGTVQAAANIVITITGNTTEGAATISIGVGTWASMLVQPNGGSWAITAATTAGSPMIEFNGADNVTFNGLNTGGNALTISNTTVSATSGTATMRFVGGATSNTITNCSVLGSSTMAVGTNGGNIFFSTDAVTTTGNDNNTISNCNIGPAGSNLPSKGIYGNGSTSTVAIGNSGIVINNNNIFDFFSATTTSSGVYIPGGCNGWSITNNKFYQTGTRTWTSGAQHSSIWLTNTTSPQGIQGFTITGNTIGFANSSGTGTYNLTGSTGKFLGIFFQGITAGTVSNINNNTIAGVNMTGVTSSGTTSSSPFSAIYVAAGNTICNANIIGSQLATGSLVFSTTTTSSTDIYGLMNFGSDAWTTSNNQIGGISVTNAGTSGAFIVYGLRCWTGSTVTWTATSNTIGGSVANSIQLNCTSNTAQLIGINTNASISTLTTNSVRNLTSNGGTGSGTTASVIGISSTGTSANQSIVSNTIFNLSNSNAGAASTVTGLHFTGSTANTVEKNFIYGLTAATTSATAEISGIRVLGGTTTYKNNMIAVGDGIANAIIVNGINEPTAGVNNFYNNSVYVGGAPTAGTANSFAFNSAVTASTRSFRDNIFVNARNNSGATGKNYIVRVGGTTANPTGLTINNNIYFGTGAGSVFGLFNSLDLLSLAAWKTAVGQDAASFSSDPAFLAPAAATPDLHINPAISTVAEGNGFAIVTVTDDFDGQTRSGLTPTDIGADAGNFIGPDLGAPAISYTALTNTNLTANRTLSNVLITDASGINVTPGTKPRLYFRKSTDTNDLTATGWKFVEANGTTSPFDFTIDYSLLSAGSVTAGNTIQYFVVAQDLAVTPNVGTNAATYTLAPTSVALASGQFPVTATGSYNITASVAGTFTVGVGQTYPTLTNAGGAFEAINNGTVTGDIILSIETDISGETGAVALNEFASPFTLTMKPNGAARVITGTSAAGLITLNGADNVTIDGSLGSTVNTICPVSTASRDLTITNTNAGTSSAVVWMQTATGSNSATGNTVKNCNITGNTSITTLFGIGSGSATIAMTSLGTANNNNSFVNNSITKTQVGIFSQGASAAAKNTGTIIRQNVMNATSPNNILRAGVFVGFDNGVDVSGNNIAHLNATGTPAFGIALGFTAGTTFNTYTTFTGNEVTGATVSNNIIDDILRTGDGSSVGICLATVITPGATVNTIANNSISGVRTTGATPSDSPFGILAGGGIVGSTRIYHNSISLSGVGASTSNTFGIAIGGTDPVVDLRNNIIVNKMTSSGKGYALGLVSTTFANMTSNNNSFFVTAGANHFDVITGGLAGSTGVTRASWATSSSKDTASLNVDPVFTSATDLRPVSTDGANAALYNGGANILALVPTDIDCASRNTAPSIGFKQFTPPVCSGATGGTASALVAAFCNGTGSTTINASGFSSGIGTTYQWQSSVDLAFTTPVSIGSPAANYSSLPTGTITNTMYYRLEVTCSTGPTTSLSTVATVTVNPTPVVLVSPTSGSYCGTGSVNLVASGATTYSWSPATGLSATTGASVTANPTTTTTYTVIGTTNGCASVGTTVTITVNAIPGTPIAGSNSPQCVGSALNLTSSTVFLPGYTVNANSGVSFVDINATGVSVGTVADDSEHNITIPSFTFNGVAYTAARVGMNGAIALGSTTGEISATNVALPSTSNSAGNVFLAPFWDDLDIQTAASIKTETVGNVFIIQYTTAANDQFTTGSVTFQVQMNLTTGTVTYVYSDVIFGNAIYDSASSATVGIQWSSTGALQYSNNTASLVDGQSITFTPNFVNYSWTGPNGFVANVQNPSIPNISTAESGIYTVTVTNPSTGCQATADTNVIVSPTTVGGAVSGDQSICGGSATNDLTLSGHTGTIVSWESAITPFTTWTPIANTTTTLNPGVVLQTTQFRAVVQSGVCTSANSTIATVTASSTTWMSGAWSNGVPDSTTAAIIASNYSSTGDLTACNLIVNNSAVVTVNTGHDFNIGGDVTVAVGASLTFENNANLLQDPLATANNNSGNIVSKRSATMRRLDYVYWGSPVSGQDLKVFSPYTVSPTNVQDIPTPVGLSRFYTLNETNNSFAVIAEPLGVNFDAAKGYMLRAPNNFPSNGSPSTFNGAFRGVPHNGDYSIAITNTPVTGSGFNMLGNPYPSPINATQFLATNPGTLYFWTHQTQDGTSSSYSTFNEMGATNPANGPLAPNGFIQTGQGFLLQTAASGTASFTNAMRSGDNQGQFFRTENVEKHRFWLSLSKADVPIINQILVGYMQGATQGFDVSVDGLLNHTGNSIASTIGDGRYAIQGRSLPFNASDVVPMAFKAEAEGTYTISLDQFDGLFEGDQTIFIKDNLTGAEQNLKTGAYSFATIAGSFSDRFQIIFQTTLGVENPGLDANTIVVYKDNGMFHINAGTTTMSSVKVFDIRGRMIYEKDGINATTTSLNNMRAEQQVLLVQITSDTNKVVTKKVIN